MALTVEELAPDAVGLAHAIVAACGRALAARGLGNWDPPYPLAAMRAECATRQVCLVRDGGAPVATFTVGAGALVAYPPAIFDPACAALYVNRLAVVPERWGGGLGGFCMDAIEARARAAAARVRLDCYAHNARLCTFYRRRRYAERGPFAVGDVPVVCFEKVSP